MTDYLAIFKTIPKPYNMKQLIFFLSLILLIGCNSVSTSNSSKKLSVFQSNEKTISLKVNGLVITQNWAVNPSTNPDVFEADCSETKNEVVFFDSKDSISFTVQLGDTTDFVIVNEAKDSAFTRIIGIQPNYNFTKAYIEKNRGKTNIEITEVSELANILIALHKDVEQDKNMTDSDSDYYQKVKAYFEPYKNHPIMDTIHQYIGGIRYVDNGTFSIFSNDSYMYYYALKMNACTYDFKADGTIVNNGNITEMARGWNTFDPFKDKLLIEDFARKSDFRAFYQENKPYYDELLETYTTLNPIADMQKWLDKKFGFAYGNYTIYFSPLVGGAHSTKGFNTKDFKQTFMFIARAEFNDEYTRIQNELLESRVVFTEIDHNYVDVLAQKHIKQINTVFAKKELWADEELTEMYASPEKVFSEYMTFAVYSLYVNDHYTEKDMMESLSRMEGLMAETRGFFKFKAFNRALLKKYQDNPTITMDELYTAILDWCAEQL